jgi:hypothetical protein
VSRRYSDEYDNSSDVWWFDPVDSDKEIMWFSLRAGLDGGASVTQATVQCDDYVAIEHIQEARIYADMNEDGEVDLGDVLVGSGTFDPVTREAVIPIAAPEIEAGEVGTAILAFVLSPSTPSPNEFYCELVSLQTQE